MYVYACLLCLTYYPVPPQNIYHLSDRITGYCGHRNGNDNSEITIRELVLLPPLELTLLLKDGALWGPAATSPPTQANSPPSGIVQCQPLEGARGTDRRSP